jgi:hypothetical protein
MKRQGIADPSEAWGQCLIHSGELAEKQGYGLIRVTGITFPGREHWACIDGDVLEEMTGKVIDLTARQFSTKVPARYEVDMETWLDDACEWLGDGLVYEVYRYGNQEAPLLKDIWVRDDIDPDEFVREEAWRNRS